MNCGSRIARELMRIARMLVAGYDTYDEDKAYYQENVKDAANLEGFDVSFDHDDIVFTYGKDETGGCQIVFGEVDGGDWGYTVTIDGEEQASVVESHPKEAYQKLLARAQGYASRMDAAIAKRFEESKAVPVTTGMGSCAISEIEDDGEFGGNGGAFRYMLSDGASFQAVFTPSERVDRRKVPASLKEIKEYIGNAMPVSWRRGENVIKFQLVNKSDMDYVKKVISGAGWTI